MSPGENTREIAQQRAAACPSSPRQQISSPDSAIYSPIAKKSSILLSMLPSAVRGRLPRLPSLRKSVSMYGLRARNGIRSQPVTLSDRNTAIVLSKLNRVDADADPRRAYYFFHETEDDRDLVWKDRRKAIELTEGKSGIGWKFAGQGLSLLSLTISESNALSEKPESDDASPSFARQLYIHAIAYLLRGLPTDLTPEECLSVRSAMPPGVVAPVRVELSAVERRSFNNLRNGIRGGTKEWQPSVLHRTLATSIINFFIIIQFLLPYIKVLLQAAYEYERNHHISEKVLASSIETVDGLGRMGIKGGGAIWSSGLVLGVAEAVNWIVEGVSGGIQEGLGEGMARVGVERGGAKAGYEA